MGQKIFGIHNSKNPIDEISEITASAGIKRLFIVCDSAYQYLSIKDKIDALPVEKTYFSDFKPNPLYENVKSGIKAYHENGCDGILAVGGGSAIDVAKCIKLYANVPAEENFLEAKDVTPLSVPFIAIPTTAGTGSESTRFAVIYYNGQKQSVNDVRIIPDFAILDGSVLMTLPDYQKKSTIMDALCQAIESWWSVNRTSESIEFSKEAIRIFSKYMEEYIFEKPSKKVCDKIMLGANYAGKAINLTQTTAAHAMSYKVTSLCGIPHGHAVAVCFVPCLRYMLTHIDDVRIEGDDMAALLDEIAGFAFGVGREDFPNVVAKMLKTMGLMNPVVDENQIEILAKSVNPVRLKNHPIAITEEGFREIYGTFLNKECK